MLGKISCLLGLWLTGLSALADSNTDLLNNLKARLHVLPQGGSLIKSYTDHSQSYIYDQALAIIAFSKAGDKKCAATLLTALQNLQKEDGSLYFSYYLNGSSPYPQEGDKRFAGAIAWVALAAITYQHHFNSKEFFSFNFQVLNYLDSQIRPFKLKGKDLHAVTFSPTNLTETTWNESETAALEHNLDAYAAFLHFATINNIDKWNKNAENLKSFIISMWDQSRSHFWSGANLKTGIINKQELYLDNQTWSLLAMDQSTLEQLNTKKALGLNCEIFLVEHEGITGLMDSKPTRRPASSQFVWSEGTAGQVLAMNKLNQSQGETFKCKHLEASALLDNIKKMKKEDGGIAYATATSNPDFSQSSSVAGTAWLYFAANNINPFHLD